MAHARLARILRFRQTWWLWALVAIVGVVHVARRLSDSNVTLLTRDGPAQWMRANTQGWLGIHRPGDQHGGFRTRVQSQSGRTVELSFKALGRVEVLFNRKSVFDSGPNATNWKSPHHVKLDLPAGESELFFHVIHRDGPAMLLVNAQPLGDVKWEGSADGQHWSSVAFADDPITYNAPRGPGGLRSLLIHAIWIIPIMIVGAIWGWRDLAWPTPRQLCVTLLIAWGALLVNNIGKLPDITGYDAREHIRYIAFIAEQKKLPLATDGWQMFQSPLFYVISAPIFAAFGPKPSDETVMTALRIFPMLCSVGQVVLCFFAARYCLPGRPRQQCLAILLGGLLPMNIYISQTVSNEPLSGLLMGLAVVLTLRWLRQSRQRTDRTAAQTGLALGLALLTKVSAVLLIPLLLWNVWMRRQGARRAVLLLAACLLVCGWYYARNVYHFHKPFVAGWEAGRILWWQDPGYRTPASFVRFGESLAGITYGGLRTLPDAIYSTLWADGLFCGTISGPYLPRWNLGLMSANAIVSLVPTLGILVGLILGWRDRCLRFASIAVLIYLAALTDLYLVLPVYSTAKATYLLGLTPVVGPLFVTGVGPLWRDKSARAGIAGIMLGWALLSYGSFFIL